MSFGSVDKRFSSSAILAVNAFTCSASGVGVVSFFVSFLTRTIADSFAVSVFAGAGLTTETLFLYFFFCFHNEKILNVIFNRELHPLGLGFRYIGRQSEQPFFQTVSVTL